MRKLKLYVWDNVYCDYSCGVCFALAESVEAARDQLRKTVPYWNSGLDVEPKVYNEPVAFICQGGG